MDGCEDGRDDGWYDGTWNDGSGDDALIAIKINPFAKAQLSPREGAVFATFYVKCRYESRAESLANGCVEAEFAAVVEITS